MRPGFFIRLSLIVVIVTWTIGSSFVQAQNFDEEFGLWPVDLTVGGSIILVADRYPKELNDLQKRIAPAAETCWLLPKKSDWLESFLPEDAKSKTLQQDSHSDNTLLDGYRVVAIPFLKPTDADVDLVRKIVPRIKKFVAAGNTLIVVGGVEWFGRWKFEANNNEKSNPGFGLIPDSCISVQHSDLSAKSGVGPNESDKTHNTRVDIQIDSGSAMWLRGRKVTTIGKGSVTFSLPAVNNLAVKSKQIEMAPGRRVDPYKYRIDLTAWRRQAIERSRNDFPAKNKVTPFVDKGTLFIVGGGGMPNGLMKQFVDAAGGKKAKLVYVPCQESEQLRGVPRIVRSWQRMGVESATFIHTKDRNKANQDDEFLKSLKEATGIWFGGGRQWNFADSWYGTKGHRYMKDVLNRGGAIGGSSAGASIQGRYLARANPLANFDIMAPGYERGLGFLSGVAIDQHFSQRRRQKDMTQLVDTYPQLLGIGIDEATAIIVKKSQAAVVGKGRVFFYDREQPVVQGKPDYTAIKAGQSFDLAKRRVIEPSSD